MVFLTTHKFSKGLLIPRVFPPLFILAAIFSLVWYFVVQRSWSAMPYLEETEQTRYNFAHHIKPLYQSSSIHFRTALQQAFSDAIKPSGWMTRDKLPYSRTHLGSIKPSNLMNGDTMPYLGAEPLKFEQAMLSNFPVDLYEDDKALRKTGWRISKAGKSSGNATELPSILNIR